MQWRGHGELVSVEAMADMSNGVDMVSVEAMADMSLSLQKLKLVSLQYLGLGGCSLEFTFNLFINLLKLTDDYFQRKYML